MRKTENEVAYNHVSSNKEYVDVNKFLNEHIVTWEGIYYDKEDLPYQKGRCIVLGCNATVMDYELEEWELE